MITESLSHGFLSGRAQVRTNELEELFRYKTDGMAIGKLALLDFTAQLRIWHVDSETNRPPAYETVSTYESTRYETSQFVVSAIQRAIRANNSDEGLLHTPQPRTDSCELTGSLLVHKPSYHEARDDEYAGKDITYKWTRLEVGNESDSDHRSVTLFTRIDDLSVEHLLDAEPMNQH